MKLATRRAPAAWVVLLLLAAPAPAAEIRMERVAATSQGFLFLEFELRDAFEGLYWDAVQSGLPTTLHYTLEVWRQRSGWWDRLERTSERQLRIFRDVLSDEYQVVTEEEVRTFTSFDSLVAAVCTFRRDTMLAAAWLPFPSELRSDRHYYVLVTANLAPLSVEDLKELDNWLKGTIRGRGGDGGGGIAGLSRTVGGLLMNLTGFGDLTVRGRTPRFKPDDILQQPLILHVPTPPPPAGPPWIETPPGPDSVTVERQDGARGQRSHLDRPNPPRP